MWTILTAFLTVVGAHAATIQPSGIPFRGPVTVAPGLKASVVFSNLTAPRGIVFDQNQNLLVVERGLGVSAFTEVPGGWERTLVIKNTALTHGIQVEEGRIFVSTADSVLTYFYDADTKTVSDSFVAVNGLPGDGELTTHSFLMEHDDEGFLRGILIGSGPLTNIDLTARDPSSGRSQIRRVTFPEIQIQIFPPPPLFWPAGEVVAYGLRNPAGFSLGKDGDLYVVENAASIDEVPGFSGDFSNDNPADELNIVDLDSEAVSYGFPDCATVWNPLGDPAFQEGTEFSLGLGGSSEVRDDAWCGVVENNQPPALRFQAHSVPLDIKFYEHTYGGLPAEFDGDAFVSFRGSFNRNPPTGYGVVRVPPLLDDGYSFIVQATNLASCPDEGRCIRPVGLAFDKGGRLFVSSDASGEIFVVESA